MSSNTIASERTVDIAFEIKLVVYSDGAIGYEMLDGTIEQLDPEYSLSRIADARRAQILFDPIIKKGVK